jgi:Fusaric acid resistance protein-like
LTKQHAGPVHRSLIAIAGAWLERIDPGTHRRIKGLRLVTAYGIAAMLGTLQAISHGMPGGASLSSLAGGIALWASVSEAQTTRAASSRDLALLCAAAVFGAVSMIILTPLLSGTGRPGPELTLAAGAFLVGYLRRFGVLGAGIGSQIFIGQLLAFGAKLLPVDLGMTCVAGVIATVAAIVPRVLSGPAEQPAVSPVITSTAVAASGGTPPEVIMGLQAAIAALVIIVLNRAFNLVDSAWAITACSYVIANSRAGTIQRVRHRIVGTAIGVPLGLACLPVVPHAAILIWVLAALAMVIYAMALPERYDIACGAYAFTLIVTLAVTGEDSIVVLASRAWETLLGCLLGLTFALFLVPLRAPRSPTRP